MLLSLRKNGLTSLIKKVRVLEVFETSVRGGLVRNLRGMLLTHSVAFSRSWRRWPDRAIRLGLQFTASWLQRSLTRGTACYPS